MSLASPSDFTNTAPKLTSRLRARLAKVPGLVWTYAVLALVVALWGTSVVLFGIPGLYIPAVALVPVIFAGLLLISRG